MTMVETFNVTDFNAMAATLGMEADNKPTRDNSHLARLRINHSAIMGEQEVGGKKVKLEVVSGGTYKLEVPDGPTYYASGVNVRPFVQRYMYKRFVKGNDSTPNRYIKTVMADNLNIDLKDNDGGFNCGKPAGYATPFIWEVENRDAFKTIGNVFVKLGKMRRLPPMHTFSASTSEQSLPNGNKFYLPETKLDLQKTLELDDDAQETLGNFLAWITNYNEYISNAWDENVQKHEQVDTETVDEFIDITEEDFA